MLLLSQEELVWSKVLEKVELDVQEDGAKRPHKCGVKTLAEVVKSFKNALLSVHKNELLVESLVVDHRGGLFYSDWQVSNYQVLLEKAQDEFNHLLMFGVSGLHLEAVGHMHDESSN